MFPFQNLMNQGGDWPPPDASPSAGQSPSPSTCSAVAAMAAVAASTVSSASLPFAPSSAFASTSASRSLSFPGDVPLGLQLPTTAAPSASTSFLHQVLAFRYRCMQCTFATADLITVHQHNLTAHNILNGSVFDTLNPTATPDILSAQSALLLSSSLPAISAAAIPTPPLPSAALQAPPPPPQDPAIVQQQIQQHYDSLAPEGQVRCETCGKYLCKTKPLSSLINHAKRHYIDKQFNCTECAYGSSEAAHVRNHMRLRHSVIDKEPEDLRDLRLQQAWMTIATKCFPSMTENLSRFRFKRFRKRRRSVPASASTSRASAEQPSSSTSTSSTAFNFESRTDSRSLTESPETPSAFRVLPPKSSSSF
ncbi:hypothetical protein QR680_017655 [Steinernema hermaphroditum]|uniref:C2H2-type domain-containing protein n=1 Tax=Steinernema hermaphroditum TaxID=289476 RepID=A0AA39HHR6_9BILA|nr:hypothetical protein QR680_017655 [Steinernema hermaphroditum]